ncbi:MAG: hypothetical protein ACI4GW_07590 [Lachnospiraceae bacterium]
MTRLNSRFNEQQYYTQGNTARKLNTVPEIIERPEEKERKERQANRKPNRNVERARAFDLKYTVMLTFATAFLFCSCFYMLSVQAEISEQRREIAMLESNLNELTDNNDETSKRLESSVNLPEIYEVATTELGMVYPKAGQVVSYEASNPDYVKQYKDVPVY